jgi:hypothetical protein
VPVSELRDHRKEQVVNLQGAQPGVGDLGQEFPSHALELELTAVRGVRIGVYLLQGMQEEPQVFQSQIVRESLLSVGGSRESAESSRQEKEEQ